MRILIAADEVLIIEHRAGGEDFHPHPGSPAFRMGDEVAAERFFKRQVQINPDLTWRTSIYKRVVQS